MNSLIALLPRDSREELMAHYVRNRLAEDEDYLTADQAGRLACMPDAELIERLINDIGELGARQGVATRAKLKEQGAPTTQKALIRLLGAFVRREPTELLRQLLEQHARGIFLDKEMNGADTVDKLTKFLVDVAVSHLPELGTQVTAAWRGSRSDAARALASLNSSSSDREVAYVVDPDLGGDAQWTFDTGEAKAFVVFGERLPELPADESWVVIQRFGGPEEEESTGSANAPAGA